MTHSTDKILHRDLIGAWNKRCYFAGRAAIETALRPYDLGSVQWYVLFHLVHSGPMMQRDLVRFLQVERATLSGIIASLLAKGLITQAQDKTDQRQKRLRLTRAGKKLWTTLPDLSFIRTLAFDGIDDADLATAVRVLQTATEQLEAYSKKGTMK
ncbi:transcriptional regulator, MarR family [Hyphomonas neptunium ATCC 15444]|uniref:Transcriptional regulator, MarR family n=1 Tax=Hyphomonas neptunium (strain ATCC 15444) TaxID=228405 RepID=Q0C054_HYPNA|nr:transcriptional regulator, MarR family [Hyphomonas neptunium ATCC 15444]